MFPGATQVAPPGNEPVHTRDGCQVATTRGALATFDRQNSLRIALVRAEGAPAVALDIDCSRAEHARIRFVLDGADHPGVVSVVGTFNQWTPGLDELLPQADGSRAVTVGVPYGQRMTFRYLAESGNWFDEPDADEINGSGSIIRALHPVTEER